MPLLPELADAYDAHHGELVPDGPKLRERFDMEKRFRQANFLHGDGAPRPSSSGSAQRPLMQRPRQLLQQQSLDEGVQEGLE